MNPLHRRDFLKTGSLVLAGVALSARSWAQVAGANSDVRVAVVGLNGRGKGVADDFDRLSGVRVVALCDVDTAVLETVAATFRTRGREVKTFVDYRDVLASKDIDAVVIATPNHWHALQAIWACQAGKDVYLEKPISHNIWEGRKVVEAAAKYNRIVQAGMQCRSSDSLAEAVAWVGAGNIGKISSARGLCYKRRDTIGVTTGPQPVPATVNYDLWVGPAPMAQPRRTKFHYDWHWSWPAGNGDLGNQGAHQMDIARWFLGESALAPRVMTVGGRLGYSDDGETPNTLAVLHDYPKAPLIFEVRGLPVKTGDRAMDAYRGASIGVIVQCEGGSIVVPSYTTAMAYDKEGKLIRNFTGSSSHSNNFIAAVRSRKAAELHGPILEGHVSSALCHVANISHRLGHGASPAAVREQIKANAVMDETYTRLNEHLLANGVDLEKTPVTLGVPLVIDPAKERFVNNDAANALLTREYRAPYVIKDTV